MAKRFLRVQIVNGKLVKHIAICFINLLSQYRKTLDQSLRDDWFLLILDGYKSRENPLSLQLFRENKIAVYVLPLHTSLITQIYDVAIGSPMKLYFKNYLKKLMKYFDPQQAQFAHFRKFVVQQVYCLH